MSRTTKSSNSPGKEYFENAAKQIPWPVEVGQKKDDYKGVIHVPHYDMDKANDNLMVSHLIHHGFVIQQTIALINETRVYDPEIRLRDVRPTQKQQVDDGFKTGDMFRVKSTKTRLEIVSCWKDSVDMKYPDGEKMPFKTTKQHIAKQLNFETWEKIS